MRIIFLLITLFSLSAIQVVAQDASGTITIENIAQQDADIAVRLREILGELGGYDDVTVIVSEGVVTLRGTTTTTADAAELTDLTNRVAGVVAVKNEVSQTTEIGKRLSPAMERFRERIDQLVLFLPLALIAAAALVAIVLLGFAIARVKQPWERIAPNAFIAEIYRQLLRLTFVVFGIVVALDIMNATALLSTILGAAGIIGLAIGFAVRDTVENFIASVMLSFRQPFRPNDTVEINGDQGKVIRLTSRATILLSFDGNHIRIPNSTVFKSRIINFSQNAERRFKFELLIDRNCDLVQARNIIVNTIQLLPFVVQTPAAQTWIESLEPNGVKMGATGWINQHETSLLLAKGEAIRLVKLALKNAEIELVDASQTVILNRQAGDRAQKIAVETTDIGLVSTAHEDALDNMISAELVEENSENLLHDDALKE